MSQLPEVQKVAAFGAVAQPLQMEVPRFREYRHHRIEVLHECEGCGEQPFLQQFEKYRFNSARFDGEPKVILFDRASGFLVRPPRIDAKPARFVRRARKDDEGFDDENVPF
jgi:hypothetical protein